VDGKQSTKREAMWQQSSKQASKQDTNTRERERERESLLCFALLCFCGFVVVVVVVTVFCALLCFALHQVIY
jgi:hypothetical protein